MAPLTQNQPKTVLLIGATGVLGSLIARALLERGVNLRLLVRPGSSSKLAADIAAASQVVEHEADAFEGVFTVVSAVQGGPDTIIEAQSKWLQAASAAGVRRFIPSDYSFDLFNLEEGENLNADWRRTFSQRAEAARGEVEVVHILSGAFMDHGVLYGFLGAFDLEKREAYVWGEGNAKMDFITYADTAAYTAEAAIDDRPLPRKFNVTGESLTFHELVQETVAGLGHPIAVKQLGSLADLDAVIGQRLKAEPNNLFAWLPMMYWRAMLNGKAKLGALVNDQYPTVRPVGLRKYLASIVE